MDKLRDETKEYYANLKEFYEFTYVDEDLEDKINMPIE